MRPTLRTARPRGGFTLIELLVVIVIVGLISAAALPVVLPALNERRVSEGARVVQAVLAGTRDAAIRANAPRGVRLLPDPMFGFTANAVAGQPLASNRFIPIEPAPDYSEGTVNGYIIPSDGGFVPYPGASGFTVIGSYQPTVAQADTGAYAEYLRVQSNEVTSSIVPDPTPTNPTQTKTVPIPQIPTGWQFNIRQGDKIRFSESGAYYTVAGPIHGRSVVDNPERYICYKTQAVEFSTYGDGASRLKTTLPLEYLDLTNGIDDDGDGWIDESCDGIDNDGDGIIDPGYNGVDDNNDGNIDEPAELLIGLNSSGAQTATAGSEYETEVFLGVQTSAPPINADYTIVRQPVVSPNAIETTLPEGVVIDLTTWNAAAAKTAAGAAAPSLPERSRLPVNPFSGYVDIMIDQTGRVVPPGAGVGNSVYNGASPLATLPFYHFWITEREDVVAPLYGTQATTIQSTSFQVPTANSNYGTQNYLLPMPQGYGTVNASSQSVVLKAQRRLVTVFTKTGQIVANSIETFNVNDTSAPYYDAQNGTKEPL